MFHMLVILAALLSLASGDVPGCPQDLPHYMRTFQDKCFQFNNAEMYWPDADDYCVKHGGRLLSIQDVETNQFITRTLAELRWSRNGVWIGLHDQRNEHTWEWSTEVRDVHDPLGNFTNWGSGHPGKIMSRFRDCVRMTKDDSWKWHETPCSLMNWRYSFICQYKKSPTTNDPGQLGPSKNKQDQTTQDIWSPGGQMNVIGPHGKNRRMDIPGEHGRPEVSAQKENNGKSDNNNGLLIGIVVLALSLVVCLLIIIMFLLYRRRRKQPESPGDSISNPVYEGARDIETPPPSMPASPIHHNESDHLLKVCGGTSTSCMDEEGACGGDECGATCGAAPPSASKKNQRVQNVYIDSTDVRNMGAAALPPKKSARQLPMPPLPDESAALYSSTEDLKTTTEDNDINNSIDAGYLDPRSSEQYVPMDGCQTSPEKEEQKVEYDTPKPENIYAEIPDRRSRACEDTGEDPYHSVA